MLPAWCFRLEEQCHLRCPTWSSALDVFTQVARVQLLVRRKDWFDAAGRKVIKNVHNQLTRPSKDLEVLQ